MGGSDKYEEYYPAVKMKSRRQKENRIERDESSRRRPKRSRSRSRSKSQERRSSRRRSKRSRSRSKSQERRSRSESDGESRRRRRSKSRETKAGKMDARSRSRSRTLFRSWSRSSSKSPARKSRQEGRKRRAISSSDNDAPRESGSRPRSGNRDGGRNYEKNRNQKDKEQGGREARKSSKASRDAHNLTIEELEELIQLKKKEKKEYRSYTPKKGAPKVVMALNDYKVVVTLNNAETKTMGALLNWVHLGRTAVRSAEEREREGAYEDVDWNETGDEGERDIRSRKMMNPMRIKDRDMFPVLEALELLLPLMYRDHDYKDGSAIILLDRPEKGDRNCNAVSVSKYREHVRLCVRQVYRLAEDAGEEFELHMARHSSTGHAYDLKEFSTFLEKLPDVFLCAVGENSTVNHILTEMAKFLAKDVKRSEMTTASVVKMVDQVMKSSRMREMVEEIMNRHYDSSVYRKLHDRHTSTLYVLLGIRALKEQMKALQRQKDKGDHYMSDETWALLHDARERERAAKKAKATTSHEVAAFPEKRPPSVRRRSRHQRRRPSSRSGSESPPRKQSRRRSPSYSASPPQLKAREKDDSTSTPARARPIVPVKLRMSGMSSIREDREERNDSSDDLFGGSVNGDETPSLLRDDDDDEGEPDTVLLDKGEKRKRS